MSDGKLVSCDGCGIVFDKTVVADIVRCPVCETTGPRVAIPKAGMTYKWWSEV